MRLRRLVGWAAAVGTVAGTLTVPLLAGLSTPAAAVSFNPGPSHRFHAPVSAMGIGAINRSVNPHGGDAPHAASGAPAGNNGGSGSGGLSSIPLPRNIIRFNTDQSYISQSETTVSVDPGNTRHVVGGVNDGRMFFCPVLPASDCPSGFTQSLSGFTTSANGGRSVTFSDDIPGLTVNGDFLASWGDPMVAAAPGGNFYYSSLAISPTDTSNGIQLSISNQKLWRNPASCTTPLVTPTVNPCWSTTFVFGFTGTSVATFEDKPMMAVDRDKNSPFYGDAYVGWDHFAADGTSSSYLARCNQRLRCTMLSGGTQPVLSGSDPFVGFTTPVVGPTGNVYVTWCNFGTATTLTPIACRAASSGPGGTSFGAPSNILSTNGGLVGYATEQFRTTNVPVLAVDTSRRTTSGNLYFTIDVCTAGNYIDVTASEPGNCGSSAVLFSRSTNGGKTWSAPASVSAMAPRRGSAINPADAVTAQPWVTVDPRTGEVDLLYYSSQFDRFDHRLDVVAAGSRNAGRSWNFGRITRTSIEPNSDPTYYDYTIANGFGGSFVVPQFGDYFQAVALNGRLWTSFNATYVVKLGTFQTDPFLAVTFEP